MEYIDGIEYNDRFISDRALDVMDTLSYLQLVGSYEARNRIIFDFDKENSVYIRYSENIESYIEYDSHKKFRVDTDDVTKEIVHLFLKIDKNIFDIVIGEFNHEEKKKYYGFKYPTYAKCYYWDERNCKKRDENFIQISCDSRVWKEFVKIRRHRDMNLEDIFKIAIDRFLEKRYDLCLSELRSDEKIYVLE